MIKNEQKFAEWIEKNELDSIDQITSTIKYLNVVSILIGEDLSETNLFDENCVEIISKKLRGLKNEKSILNYKLALRKYVRMIESSSKTTLAKKELS